MSVKGFLFLVLLQMHFFSLGLLICEMETLWFIHTEDQMKCLQFQQLKMISRNIVAIFNNTEYLQKTLTTLPIWKYHGNRETPLKKLLEMQKESNSAYSPFILNSPTV